jgi:hypothetical protein
MEDGTLDLRSEVIPESTIEQLSKRFDLIFTEAAAPNSSISTAGPTMQAAASSCPLPSSFTIAGDANGEPVSEQVFPSTNRPPGANTQWIVFDFFTYSYRGSNAHMPVVLRFKDVIHGWGAFFGENSGSSQGCGASSEFNTQIQGWVQQPPFPGWNPDVDPPPPPGPTWQSLAYKGSCGTELYDGPAWDPVTSWTPRYRMTIHSASSHWAAYQVQEWFAYTGWSVVTPWTALDTDQPDLPPPDGTGANWLYPPPPYDQSSTGIFIWLDEVLQRCSLVVSALYQCAVRLVLT